MINGSIEQFLDTGWYQEAELFYNGFVYWCEGYFENGAWFFKINKWRARLIDRQLYSSYIYQNKAVDFCTVFEYTGTDLDVIKNAFLTAPIFDNKTFWDVENELVWVDWSEDTIINSRNEI